MKEACNKCKYLHPKLKGGRYFKCYCGDCPAKKRDEAGKIPIEVTMIEEIKQVRQALGDADIVIKDMDMLRKYWKKAYIEECRKQDEWVEDHLQLVKRLLKVSSREEGSLEDFLFRLYRRFEHLEKQIKVL